MGCLHRKRLVAGLACMLAWSTQTRAVDLSELKAAITYNVLLFVEWPPAAVTGTTLVLCVDAASALAAPMRTLEGQVVRNLKLEVQMLKGEPARRCHALYVDATPGSRSAARSYEGHPVLVVADDSSASEAATVRLVQSADRYAFDVDLAQARRAQLQLSSRLLRLARRVSE